MNAYDTLHFIDNLLFELWYTDDRKENFDKELFYWIENLDEYLNVLELENKNLNKQNDDLRNENKQLKEKLN